MLRRLTIGLFTLACAAAIAACSSNTSVPSSGGIQGVGPNFVTNTIYVSDTTQNAVEIYTPSPSVSATPQYNIGGSNTSLNGPSYMAFNTSKQLYVTNYNASTKLSSLTAYQTYATGNVLPLANVPFVAGVQPHGLAMLPNNAGFAITFTQPGGFFTSSLQIFSGAAGSTAFVTATIAGSNTLLNNPVGVVVDANKNLFVANSGDSTVRMYAMPSPSPAPSVSPTATPTPSPTPSVSPSVSPSPTPTPVSDNVAPTSTIRCAPGAGMPNPCMTRPTGIAMDGAGNLYVTDPDNGAAPAVYVFSAASIACTVPPCSLTPVPVRAITANGATPNNTKLVNPTDVVVDSSGNIYVVDAGNAPNSSMLLIFSPAASGNVAPKAAVPLLGTATGMTLSP